MTIILGLLILDFLVFFHELGHFLAARLCGVTVESFSIGMGPVLLHKKIGGTDYRISLLPVGGYCGMKGETEFSKAVEEGLGYVPGEKDSLYGTSPLKRALIGFAGPLFNLVFAFIAGTIICITGYTYYTRSAVVDIPEDKNFVSPAREAGILSGDLITEIAGHKISDFSDIYEQVSLRGGETVEVVVMRKDGDENKKLIFSVPLMLDKKHGNGILGVQSTGGVIEKKIEGKSFFPALGQGFLNTGKLIGQTVKSLGILFKGIDVTNAVSGPARISSMLGESAKEGFSAGFKTGLVVVMQFLALISISLFIMNLLPIPILDGGIILFAMIQTVTKKQIPPKIQYRIQVAGFVIIMMIFMIGVSGDIRYFWNKGVR